MKKLVSKKAGVGFATMLLGTVLLASAVGAATAVYNVTVQANSAIKILVDGKTLDTAGKVPLTRDGFTYLPVASIAKATGANVAYDNKTKTISITTSGGKSESTTPVEEPAKESEEPQVEPTFAMPGNYESHVLELAEHIGNSLISGESSAVDKWIEENLVTDAEGITSAKDEIKQITASIKQEIGNGSVEEFGKALVDRVNADNFEFGPDSGDISFGVVTIFVYDIEVASEVLDKTVAIQLMFDYVDGKPVITNIIATLI